MNKRVDIIWRVWLVGIALAIFGGTIFVRAGITQFKHGDKLIAESDSLEVTVEVIPAQRGNILASDGRLLSTTVKLYSLHMDFQIKGVQGTEFNQLLPELCDSLASVFDSKTSEQWMTYMKKGYVDGARYYFLADDLTYSQKERIKSFPWFDQGRYTSGLIIEHSIDRMLPFDGLAQRTIGYIRQTGDTSKGIVGLEHYFNAELEGEKGLVFRKVVSQQTTLPHIERDDVEPDPGLDIHTTLDIDLQDFADATLRKSLEEHNAKNGCVVLMEVGTGNVLTLVNLERNSEGEYVEDYNHAVGTLFEPGSTMKVPVMAALLENGLTLDHLVSTHNGDYRVSGVRVPESTRPKKDYYDPYDIIKYSSNIGIAQLVEEGFQSNVAFRDALYDQLPFETTGITIHGEGRRMIPDVESWGGTDKAWKSFGYGLELTALHILTHYNAIANRGIAVQPRLVSHTSKLGETVKSFPTNQYGRIMSVQTAQDLTSMMKLVVNDPRGTAHSALSSRNVAICGKTGTTKIKDVEYNYEDDMKRALFCGFFPVEKPQYSMIVVMSYIDAKEYSGIGGGSTAAPVFGDIAEFAYARIGTQKQMSSTLLASEGAPMSSMLSDDWQVLSDLLDIDSEQPLYAISQVDLNETNDYATISIADHYRTEENKIPYLEGMGLSDAVSLCSKYGYRVSCEGFGHVVTQWPEAGSSADRNSKIHLVLQ